jgi:hypothetical protein
LGSKVAFLSQLLYFTLGGLGQFGGGHPSSFEKVWLWPLLLEYFLDVFWLEFILIFEELGHIDLFYIKFIQEIMNWSFFLRNLLWNICLIIYTLIWPQRSFSLIGGCNRHFKITLLCFFDQTESWSNNRAVSVR